VSVREGTATSEHLFLWIERSSVIIVPIRSLPPGMPLMEFQSKLDLMHDAASRRRIAAVSGAAKDRSAPRTRMAAATSLVDS